MDSFSSYLFRKTYKKIHELGDRLAKIEPLIDWEAFRPIIAGLYDNKTEKGGKPNVDEVVMVKMLALQEWYGLSDPELERQANDRISFCRFLGFPGEIPDATTVWLFRERLSETGKDRAVWAELQRELDEKGLKVRKGVVQDPRSSRRTPVMLPRISRGAGRRGPVGAGTAAGPRRAADPSSGTSCTPRRMSISVSSETWRRQRPASTTAGWT
jgi:IS5 family transposase